MDSILTPETRQMPAVQRPLTEQGGVLGGISLVLNALSLMVAFILVVVLFFTWQSVADLTELEKRLGELTQFEKRIGGKLDTVNHGLHSQFDQLNQRLSQLSGEVDRLDTEFAALRQNLARLAEETSAFDGGPTPMVSIPDEEPLQAGDEVEPSADPVQAAPARAPAAASQPVGSPRFQRSQTPDGKVTYSKVR